MSEDKIVKRQISGLEEGAPPDCDWKDKKSEKGCISRSVFRMRIREEVRHQGLKLVTLEQERNLSPFDMEWLFACGHHAKEMFDGLCRIAAEFQRASLESQRKLKISERTRYTVLVERIELARERAKNQKAIADKTALLLLPGKDF